MELRYYQADAITAFYQHLRTRSDNPCVVIPTGGGKTPVIASICRDAAIKWSGRVCVLSHVKELIEQSANTIRRIAPELALHVGIYSAGLNSRRADTPIVCAGIQSVYKKAYDMGPFNLILVDEAHLIPPDGDGMYQTFIREAKVVNPKVRIMGLTATPYRMSTGMICGEDRLLNHVCYEVGVRELILGGYLSKLRSRVGAGAVDLSGVAKRGGEFVEDAMQAMMDHEALIRQAVDDIKARASDRKSILVFCAGVQHAGHVAAAIRSSDMGTVAEVYGHTSDAEREAAVAGFKSGAVRVLVNVSVLTTGFDAPNVDCVVLLRGTMSPGLYYQMVGRGFRLAAGKSDCLVLDYAGNVVRHGPVDMIQPKLGSNGEGGEAPGKVCEKCGAVVAIAYTTCPECGHEFPVKKKDPHADRAGDESVLSGEVVEEWVPVSSIDYAEHQKKNAPADAPRTLRVTYRLGLVDRVSEWICVEHPVGSFAHNKALAWWKNRTNHPMPGTADECVTFARGGNLRPAIKVLTRRISGEKWPSIVDYELGEPVTGFEVCECGETGRTWVMKTINSRASVYELCAACGKTHRAVPQAEVDLAGPNSYEVESVVDDDIPF